MKSSRGFTIFYILKCNNVQLKQATGARIMSYKIVLALFLLARFRNDEMICIVKRKKIIDGQKVNLK